MNLCEITNAEEVLQEKGCQVELDAMELVHVKEKEDWASLHKVYDHEYKNKEQNLLVFSPEYVESTLECHIKVINCE